MHSQLIIQKNILSTAKAQLESLDKIQLSPKNRETLKEYYRKRISNARGKIEALQFNLSFSRNIKNIKVYGVQ